MSAAKWIGGFLGFITTGSVLGALAGYALGALFSAGIDSVNTPENNFNGNDNDPFGRNNNNQSRFNSSSTLNEEGQRNSFFFSLLVLAAYIIRSDGKVMHSEMEALRHFLRTNFGPDAEQQGNDIILKIFEREKALTPTSFQELTISACHEIRANMLYEQRMQLFAFLQMLAEADKHLDTKELNALQLIGQALGLTAEDMMSMLNMKKNDLDSAYKVLGISPSATDDEVKAAYRKMALKHHPDRVSALGEDVKRAAEAKFQEINQAKERIYKARGL